MEKEIPLRYQTNGKQNTHEKRPESHEKYEEKWPPPTRNPAYVLMMKAPSFFSPVQWSGILY